MSLRVYKCEEYNQTHERQQYRALCEALKSKFGNSQEEILLFANINFTGVPLDALLIKRDAIIVVEFKNYGGHVTAAENGPWGLSDGTIIKGGGSGKNPFMQVRENRWNTVTTFSTWFFRPYVNLGHTSGLVVFNKPVIVDDKLIFPKTKSWFHITDMEHVVGVISDITSPKINYTHQDLLDLPKVLNCESLLDEEHSNTKVEKPEKIMDAPEFVENTTKNDEQVEIPAQSQDLYSSIEKAIKKAGFNVDIPLVLASRPASYHEDISVLSSLSRDYVKQEGLRLYEHQYLAALHAKNGENVCLTTSTSSGKTIAFHLAALETLARNPQAKVLAIYPMRVLNHQQEERWHALESLNVKVGRIDGNVKNGRKEILEKSQILVMTPDVVHAFLMGKLSDRNVGQAVVNFLRNLKLVIIDELHIYKGVLGSNSAYLFRRLNSVIELLNSNIPQYITASATIARPDEHSEAISGVRNFVLIGQAEETSPRAEVKVFMARGQQGCKLDSLLEEIRENLPDKKTILFTDSRKDVTTYADTKKGVYPVKAGYEENDFEDIMKVFKEEAFKGVVSTSCMEVGVDIGGLDIAILKGVPNSTTSLMQRLGRIGRRDKPSVAIILEEKTNITSQLVFRDPQKLFRLPHEEPALYLDNNKLVAIQALHFVGNGMEFQNAGGDIQTFRSIKKNFAGCDKFIAACRNVLEDQWKDVPEYQEVHEDAPERTEMVFTLRSFGKTMQVKNREKTGEIEDVGTLTMNQVMREAYPKALYEYVDHKYRVKSVSRREGEIIVEREDTRNRTHVNPQVWITPQRGTTVRTISYGTLEAVNMSLMETTQITEYYEYLPPRIWKDTNPIPCPLFTNKILTTGVMVMCPELNEVGVEYSYIGHLLYECFLASYSFDRSDIEHGWGKLGVKVGNWPIGTKFFAIYDKVPGGLNITSRLMERGALLNGLKQMVELVKNGGEYDVLGGCQLKPASKKAICAMLKCVEEESPKENSSNVNDLEYAIARDSIALYVTKKDNEVVEREVTINEVVYDTLQKTLYYDVELQDGTELCDIEAAQILPIPGRSAKAKIDGARVRTIRPEQLW